MATQDHSSALTDKWNQRYRKAREAPQACSLLSAFLGVLDQPGRALDLACGRGGNALLLASGGWTVDAWDCSDVALTQLAGFAGAQGLDARIHGRCVDVEKDALPAHRFDLIVVSYFLNRALCGWIEQALSPGGMLMYQTFHRRKLDAVGPSNPAFLLGSNELLQLFPGLDAQLYWDGFGRHRLLDIAESDACLIARKPET